MMRNASCNNNWNQFEARMNSNSTKRKALMLSPPAHDVLMRLASTYEVTQCELADALVECLDMERLKSHFGDRARERENAAARSTEKRMLVEQFVERISLDELRVLLSTR